jgi:hypothetical protein
MRCFVFVSRNLFLAWRRHGHWQLGPHVVDRVLRLLDPLRDLDLDEDFRDRLRLPDLDLDLDLRERLPLRLFLGDALRLLRDLDLDFLDLLILHDRLRETLVLRAADRVMRFDTLISTYLCNLVINWLEKKAEKLSWKKEELMHL